MITVLTMAVFVLRIALTLVVNSLRLGLKATLAGVKAGGKVSRVATKHALKPNQRKWANRGIKVAQKSVELTIRVLDAVLKLLDIMIGVLLTSLIGAFIFIIIMIIFFTVSSFFPFMYLSTEEGGLNPNGASNGGTVGQVTDGNKTGRGDPDLKWDFEIVPFDQVQNILPWVKQPQYMEGLTEETKYVVRVLNGKFPDAKIMSLYRAGESGNGEVFNRSQCLTGHGAGRAVDLEASGEEGWQKAKWLAANAEKLKITELIYQVKYWNIREPDKGFQDGILERTGNKTADHEDHVHISVNYYACEGDYYTQ